MPHVQRIGPPLGAGIVVLYFSFHAGGYFPGATGTVACALMVVLVARIVFADRPLRGVSYGHAIGAAALAMFGLWTFISGHWSNAPGRALIESDRVLLYLAGFLLFGALGRTADRLRWMVRGIAAAATIVCLCALITRLLPDVWTLPPSVADERLNYPLTYWNSLGLLAALGSVLCFGLTADDGERPLGRVLAAAALPVLATTLLLTFSRASIAAGAVGVLALVLVGRPRALLSAIAATLPTVLVSVLAGYSADLLATDHPTTGPAAHEGHIVAVVVLLCVIVAVIARRLLLRFDGTLAISLPAPLRRPPGVWGLRAGACLVVVLGLFVWPIKLPNQVDSFVNGDPVASTDLRGRLVDTGDNGRIQHWRAALVGFHEEPLIGTGAGTFALQWDRVGTTDKLQLQDAHSLYVEVLGELGLIGFLFVVSAVIAVLVGFYRCARSEHRLLGGALFGAGLTWAIAAGVDWAWEMPAVTFWFFAAGGLALAAPDVDRPAGASRLAAWGRRAGGSRRPGGSRDAGDPRARPGLALDRYEVPLRIAVGLGCLWLALVPVRLSLSDSRLRASVRAFDHGDCGRAIDRALASISAVADRPEPHQLLGYCDVRLGKPQLAVIEMRDAVRRDPHNWEAHYGLALARAANGQDPRLELRTARRLNPRDSTVAVTLRLLQTNVPQQWRRLAGSAALPQS
jgi:hypothetical protein